MNKIALVLLGLGAILMITGQVFGLSISPGEDPNFSYDTYLVEVYRGYEVWRDPARGVDSRYNGAEWIIYTPSNVEPVISSIKYSLKAAKTTIDNKISSSEVVHTTNVAPTDVRYELVIGSGPGGKVTPSGTLSYKEGVTVSISKSADDGYVFDYMTVNGNKIEGARTAVTMDRNYNIMVYWKTEPISTDTNINEVQSQINTVYLPEQEGRQTYLVRGTGLGLMGLGLVMQFRKK